MGYRNQVSINKTFHEWCVENNRLDLDERFDIEKNGCTTNDIAYKSNKRYWFKCPRNLHESEENYILVFINNPKSEAKCRRCNSIAQIVIDRFGEDYLKSKWHSSNKKSPWDINYSSKEKVIIQCDKKEYHVYEQDANSFSKGIGCPYCRGLRVHHLDSFGAKYPEAVGIWSDKNEKSPYEYSPCSGKKAWFKCKNGKHDDYERAINGAVRYNFQCYGCRNDKISLMRSGENNHFWRGGINKEKDNLRHRREYYNWRTLVYERDNYTCQCCGKRGGRLNSHHVYQFADFENLRYDIDNGLTLCEDCHDSTKEGSFHNIYGTHDNTPEQLREYILNKSNIDIFETHPKILSLTTQN